MPDGSIPAVAPDIAIEILSKSNTVAEMRRKVREYFNAGSRLVVLIDPKSRTTRRYTSPEVTESLSENDSFTLEPWLPGFSAPLRSLFEEAARRSKMTEDPPH
jgi:Uma2 family endonuclease